MKTNNHSVKREMNVDGMDTSTVGPRFAVCKSLMSRLLLFVFILSQAFAAYSQYSRAELRQRNFIRQQRTSNITLALGGGVSELVADGRLLDPSFPGAAVQFDAAYTYLWDRLSGIRVGLGFSYAHSSLSVEGAEMSSMGTIELFDADGTYTRTTHFTASATSVSEGYNVIYASMPIQLVLQNQHFFSALGFRLMVPLYVGATFSHGETQIGVGREVDGTGTTLARPVEIITLDAADGTYSMKASKFINVAAALEVGYRHAINNKQMLTVALYADIALNRNNLEGNGLASFDSEGYHITHALESGLVSSLRYCAVGIKLSYGFTFGNRIRTGNPFRLSRNHRPRYVM